MFKQFYFNNPWSVTMLQIVIFGVIGYYLYRVFWLKGNAKRIFPSLCTALGVLGTFLSLVLAFVFINISDPNEVSALPVQLSMAFITSIIGIISSQFFSYKLSKSDSEDEKVKDYLMLPPEQVLFQLRNNSDRQNVEIIKNLEALNFNITKINNLLSDIAPNMTSSFGHAMGDFSKNMAVNVSQMSNSLTKQMQDLSWNFQSIIQDASSKFDSANDRGFDKMNENMSDLFYNVNSSFETLIKEVKVRNTEQIDLENEMHKETMDIIRVEGERSLSVVENLQNKMQEMSDSTVANFAQVCSEFSTESSKMIEKAHSGMDKIIGRVDNMASNTTNSLNATNERLRSTVELFDDRAQYQKEVLNSVEDQILLLKTLRDEIENDRIKFSNYEDKTTQLGEKIAMLEEKDSFVITRNN